MNKKSPILFLGVAVMLVLSACSHSDKYASEIKQLDSLSLLIDSAALKVGTIDTMKIHQYKQEVISNLDFIEKNNRDTISRDMAFLLSEYSSLREIFKMINMEFVWTKEELNKSKAQIGNLIHDFKTNKVDETKAGVYLQEERDAAQRVVHSIEIISTIAKENLEKFEIANPKVLEFINEIKAKQSLVK